MGSEGPAAHGGWSSSATYYSDVTEGGSPAHPSPVKDLEHEQPVPDSWRPVFRSIVSAFVRRDFRLSEGIPGVAPVDEETASQIERYISNYGSVTLTELPDETWDSSVAIWVGTHWETLVDLWTEEEGRSDMVVSAFVREVDAAFEFEVYMVYVP